MEKLKIFYWNNGSNYSSIHYLFINCWFYNNNNDIFVGLCTLFTGILAIIGVCFTIFNSQSLKNKELLEEEKLKTENYLMI